MEKTCCFFGHSKVYDDEGRIFDILMKKIAELIENGFDTFLFGGYGEFDGLCCHVTNILKKKFTSVKTVYVQAYYHPHEKDWQWYTDFYDEIIYPEIEGKYLRFAIQFRNQKIIEMSDFCIFYVKRNFGGAFQALNYAKRKAKNYENIIKYLSPP